MAIAFRAAGAVSLVSSGSTVTPALPAGLQTGDLMIACIALGSTATVTPPTGYTAIKNSLGVGASVSLFVKIAGAAETAAAFTFSTTACEAYILAYSGVSATTPIMQASTAGPTTATSLNDTQITAAKATTLVSFFGQPGTFTVTDTALGAATLTATRVFSSSGSTSVSVQATEATLGSGSTGGVGHSTVTSSSKETILLALNPDDTFAVTGTADGTGTLAWPTVAPGSLALMMVSLNGASAVTTPSGWTAIYADYTVGTNHYGVFYKILTAADLASALTVQALAAAALVFVVGMNPSTPISTQGKNDYTSNVTTFGWPSVTPTFGGTKLFAIAGIGTVSSSPTQTNDAGLSSVVGSPWTTPLNEEIAILTATGPTAGTATTAFTRTTGTPAHTETNVVIAVNGVYSPPLAPTLGLPLNNSYQDLAAGFTFTWSDNFRYTGDTQAAYALRRKISGAGAYEYWNAGTLAWQSTIVWNSTATQSVTFAAGKWTDGNIYNWSVATQGALGPGGAGSQGSFAADNTVTASATPTVTVTAPSGTASSSTPVVSWTETLQSGSAQTAYEVVVESGSYGTIPGSGTAVWDSVVVSSAALAATVGVALTNSITYRVFVQVTETGGQTSAWSYSTFTVTYDAPAVPTLTAVSDTPNARIVLTVQGRDNLLSLDDSSFETTTGTWVSQTNCTVVRSTAQFLDGSASLALTSAAAGSMSARTAQGVSGYAVQPGKQYTALASFRAAASVRTATVTVNWWQASGAASAVRASDTSTGVADATGAWSAHPSLTAISPSDAAFASISVTVAATGAAGEVHYLDEVSLAPGASTAWTLGGFAGAGVYTVEVSGDGGVTWTTVRGAGSLAADSAADQQVVVYDYERPPLSTASYRARVTNGSGSSAVTSDNSAVVTVAAPVITTWWVKDVRTPALNHSLCDAQQNVRTSPGDAVAIYPAGRTNPLVLKGPVHGASSRIRTVVQTEADRTAMLALFASQGDLLVQDPRGRQWYAEWVGDLTETQFQVDQPYYAIERGWVEVDVPS